LPGAFCRAPFAGRLLPGAFCGPCCFAAEQPAELARRRRAEPRARRAVGEQGGGGGGE